MEQHCCETALGQGPSLATQPCSALLHLLQFSPLYSVLVCSCMYLLHSPQVSHLWCFTWGNAVFSGMGKCAP